MSSAMPGASDLTDGQPRFDRYRVGDAEVVVLYDGCRSFPLAPEFIPNARIADINAALAEAGLPADEITLHFNPVVVINGGKRVLIDTGNGPDLAAQEGSKMGRALASMEAAGIAPDSIDAVVISHFHGDHVNGLIRGEGEPVFANAEILVPEAEWAYWMDDGEMARAPAGRMETLFRNNRRVFGPVRDRVRTYANDREVTPGMTPLATPGHTPGHVSYVLSSGTDSVFIQNDVTNQPALFARNPGWHVMFDQDPVVAETTRRRIYDMLAAERMLVQGFHYLFPSRGHVEKAGDGYRVVPA